MLTFDEKEYCLLQEYLAMEDFDYGGEGMVFNCKRLEPDQLNVSSDENEQYIEEQYSISFSGPLMDWKNRQLLPLIKNDSGIRLDQKVGLKLRLLG